MLTASKKCTVELAAAEHLPGGLAGLYHAPNSYDADIRLVLCAVASVRSAANELDIEKDVRSSSGEERR